MPEIHLLATLKTPIIMLAAGLALAMSFFVYRHTVPPISRALKTILVVLRACSLFLVFLLIGEPLLSLISREEERPIVAVLVDNSRSMTIMDKSGGREAALVAMLQSAPLRQMSSIGSVLYGTFDTRVCFLRALTSDSLSLAGDGTDLGSALRGARDTAARANLQSVILITDGNSTVGTSPLYEAEDLAVPVFTIGVGDTSEQQDVLIRKVVTNSITYVGNKVPVDVTVKSSGYDGEKIEVMLREGAKVVDRQTLTLQRGTREYAAPLSFVPETEGMQKLVVEVSQLPNEISLQNNRYTSYIKVLKSKMRVVLVAGAPGPDVSFIRRALEGDKNIELSTRIERGDGRFYEGQLNADLLRESEAVVLVGYPIRSSSDAAISAIIGAVGTGQGLLFVLSRTTDLARLRSLEPLLPMILPPSGGEEVERFVSVPIAQRNNPILKLPSSPDVWNKLPPVFTLDGRFRAKPESEVLAQLRIQSITTNDPVIVTRNVNRRKSIALLGYGIWRWKTFSDGIPGSENALESLFSNSVRWLTTREDDRAVRIQPVKETFSGQDPIEFTAQVYDKNFNPLDDAEVSVAVKQADKSDQLSLVPIGNGRFEGTFGSLPEGDYTFTARVLAGGEQIAEERGSFSVGGVNVEFQETRMNRLLLQQIAERTGGRYYDAGAIATLPQDVASLPGFQPRQVVRSSEIELWNRGWMLAVIVLLFASEWFLRKRNGML